MLSKQVLKFNQELNDLFQQGLFDLKIIAFRDKLSRIDQGLVNELARQQTKATRGGYKLKDLLIQKTWSKFHHKRSLDVFNQAKHLNVKFEELIQLLKQHGYKPICRIKPIKL